MSSNSNSNQNNWIFSGLGVILVAALLVIFNMIVSGSSAKIDATEQKLHTLTDGTKAILGELDESLAKYDSPEERARLAVKFYATYDKDVMPPQLADHAKKVEAMLREFVDHSDDRIKLEVIDPEPYSADERAARENGVTPVTIDRDTGAQIFLGVSVSSLVKTVQVSFLNPENARLLEYDLARAVSEASVAGKPTLGLMTTYEMSGGTPGSQPWFFRTQLERDYTVQTVPMDADKIDSNIDALVVVHPASITDRAQYAIDQYLLGGGKVLAMLDAFSLQNRQAASQQQGIPGMPPPSAPVSSDMGKLLKAWGVQFESVNVVADRSYMNRNPRMRLPVFIGVPGEAIDDEHSATKGIQYLDMSFSGAFYGDGASGLEKKVLVKTSDNAGTVSPHPLFDPGQNPMRTIVDTMEESSTALALVLSLSGDFVSAFPDGAPDEEDAPEKSGESEDDKEEKASVASLKKSSSPGQVILIADTDMITEANAPRIFQFEGHAIQSQPPNGNLALVDNLIGFIAGNSNLLKVRSRGNITRPFTKYQKLIEESSKKEQDELGELIDKRETAQDQYSKAKAKHERGEEISAEDLKVIREYDDREERSKTEDRIIELRHQLNKNVNRIEARWKWLNIALVPLIVVIAAIGHLVLRRSKTSAR